MSLVDIPGEEWRPTHIFGDSYMVSSLGRVKSVERERMDGIHKSVMLSQFNEFGYLLVNLCSVLSRKKCRVHRLVASSFIENPENKPQVNHDDGDKTNNAVPNLCWSTSKENIDHAWKNGLSKPRNEKAVVGTRISNGEKIEFDSSCMAARSLKIQQSSISSCCLGKRKRVGDFMWSFKEEGVIVL